MVAAEMLLLLRTLALWNENNRLKAALVIIYALSTTVTILCTGIISSIGSNSSCAYRSAEQYSEEGYRLFTGPYWGVASFEFAVVCVTVYHGYYSRVCLGPYSGMRLVKALRQGNLVYAWPLFAVSIANITLYFQAPSDGWVGLLFGLQCVFHGALGARITFALRRADRREDPDTPLSQIRFALAPMCSCNIDTAENTAR
ncbi:hypothetical protein BV22DRAFT_1034551 [Leucogyrophana mollusca]|uniref:Uncharacterized protein n=1 Tax=Leucogyrophana mollusca TaxID=85980 RepID=A0ACB8BJE4_9AGAM|nr:hypothetical protein BV22DRAFT_1034551 [Leucogyrophana mollusca]